MEFYIHNKDDQKLKTSVNLGTTFKLNETNYIVYYNTQVEKSVIDIYIGCISYGDQSLVINKIDNTKQNEFLATIKEILAGKNPETEISDYANIIDTATIILDAVQKIQIPTSSLENLKKYHSNEKEEISSMDEIVPDSMIDESQNSKNEEKVETNNDVNDNNIMTDETLNSSNIVEDSNITNSNPANISVSTDDRLSSLDNLLNEHQEQTKKKKNKEGKKEISTPLLVALVLTIVVAVILMLVGNIF